MKDVGPLLETLTHRLAECPREFLDEPRISNRGKIYVDAVVNDLILDLGETKTLDCSMFKISSSKDKSWLRLVLICSWLLADEWFCQQKKYGAAIHSLLVDKLQFFVEVVEVEKFIFEPDRREELVRYCLNELGLRPKGETKVQAKDRLNSLDTIERIRVIKEAKRAEEHAKKVREAMRRRQSREAAARVMRE